MAVGSGSLIGDGAINSVAVGARNIVSDKNSTAVGQGNTVTGDSSGAFGNGSGTTIISGAGSYAVGNANVISTASTFALGSNISTTTGNSVFLGDSTAYVSPTTRTKGVDNTYINNTNPIYAKSIDPATPGAEKPIFAVGALDFAGGNEVVGVVSVGNGNETRRIQNVAPGLISNTSTDAINGSQLYAAIGGLSVMAGNNVEFTTDPTTGRTIIHALNAIVNTDGSGGGSGSGNGGDPTTGSGSGNASTGNTPTSTANTGSLVDDGSQSGIAPTANAHTTTYYAVSPQNFEDLVNGGDPDNGKYGLMVGATPKGQDMTAGQPLKNSLFSVKGGEGAELSAISAGETLRGGDPADYSARNLTTRLSTGSSGDNTVYVMMSENPTFGRGSRRVEISGDKGSVTATDGSSTTTIEPAGITVSGSGSYQPVVIQQGNVSMGGNRIKDVAPGVDDTDAVNVSQLKSQHINISDGRSTSGVYGGDTINFRGDRNIHVSVDGLDIHITLDPDLNVRSVTTGRSRMDNDGFHVAGGPSVTVNGIDAAGTRITNVAPGIDPYDAVNRAQLDGLDNRLSNRIDKAYGGIATVAASVGVPQTTVPGANMLGAALGGFEGETALAVGYSAMSDNGHWIWKNVLSASSEEVTWTTGLGYQW